jgi:hypothetical protein
MRLSPSAKGGLAPVTALPLDRRGRLADWGGVGIDRRPEAREGRHFR